MKLIVDGKGDYPVELSWGWLENRHIIRAIGNWGRKLWEEGKSEGALDVFRRLLAANPNDNLESQKQDDEFYFSLNVGWVSMMVGVGKLEAGGVRIELI
ncbi:MAG: hypothetical protein HY376_04250 [Candidatus Blackburnbacteria bacterium]|nr:hypothetical protein [Candidatus Blackburnbacteria bacterium]